MLCGKSSVAKLFAKIKKKKSPGTDVHFNLKFLTCDSLICKMSHPRFIVLNEMEEFFSIQKKIRRLNI